MNPRHARVEPLGTQDAVGQEVSVASLATPPAGPPREPPPVTVTGGRAAAPAPDVLDGGPPARRTGPWLAGLAAGLVLLAAVASADRRPPPAPALEVGLTLVDGELLTSRSGVLVVPVQVQGSVSGAAVAVELARAVVWAAPVREQPTATGRTRFGPGVGGRLRVLLRPDCRMLVPGSEIAFAATLEVAVTDPGGRGASAVLDLAAHPALAGRMSALCRPGDGLRLPGQPDVAPAPPAIDDGTAVGCPQGLCTGARDTLRG